VLLAFAERRNRNNCADQGAIGVLYEAGAARFRDEIGWNWFWESAIGLRE
jgi:hypothetical protein